MAYFILDHTRIGVAAGSAVLLIFIFDNIESFYIGKDKYTLSYTPMPKEDYHRIMRNWKDKISIKKLDGKKHILNEKSYVKLIHDFGKLAGFVPMKFKMIQERI